MDTLLQYYKKIYSDLDALNGELVLLYRELASAQATHSENVSNAKQLLQEKLEENKQRITKVNAFIGIAKTHSIKHIEAASPKPFDSGVLSRLSVQINSGLVDDPFAIQLYTEATAQLMYLETESGILSKETDVRIQTFERQYMSNRSTIEDKIANLKARIKEYLYSDSFASFIKHLQADKYSFNGGADRTTLLPDVIGTISLGSIELPFPVAKGMETDFVELSKGFCNANKATISVPANISIKIGNVIIAEYENTTEAKVLLGIQNIILNIARYYGQDFTQVVFVDPIRFNASSLGCLSRLSGSGNSFIDSVPTSIEDIRKKLKTIISEINIREVRSEHLSVQSKKKALYVFHDFPQAYDANLVGQIQQLCVNAEHYGIVVVLTHNKSSKNYTSSDTYQFLQNIAINIKTNADQQFLFGGSGGSQNTFIWYSAPNALPADVERVYIDERPVVDLSNDYIKRVGLKGIPHYEKGKRSIEKIPFGIDSQGNLQYLDFENSNFATFICGAARSGKSTLLHTLISGMIKNNHPDDIEIWLIDFKMTEFSRYINHTPPHVRYIILDESPELVYDIIDRLTEILIKRQNMFKGKWLKLGEVPAEKYMPAIMVIIDEFSVMSQIIADSIASSNENYSVKLQMLLAKGAALGLHFIFASQGFTSGTRGLNDFSKKQIQQRIAMKTEYNEIKETLDLKSASDEDKALMEQLPVHHTLTRIPADERGNHLMLSQALYISDYIEQETLIDAISESVKPLPKYDATNAAAYISKKPMIIDGNLYLSFNSKKAEMSAYYSSHQEFVDEGEFVLFVGEPRRMMPLFPITVANEFCENVLIVAPANEKMAASSVVLSIARSLEMQGQTISLWTTKKNPIYRQIMFECEESFPVQNNLVGICGQIKELKSKIQSNIESNKYFVLLGFETLFTDMAYQLPNDTSAVSNPSQTTYEKRAEGEPDLNSLLEALTNGTPIPNAFANDTSPSTTRAAKDDSSYDAREDLKFILTNGPRLGYHFVLSFGTIGDVRQTKLDTSLFKHKILFRTAKQDAMTVIGTANASVVAELEDHSFRYSNGLDNLSFRPFLHPGLSWDGWQISGNDVVNSVDEEEEYLL